MTNILDQWNAHRKTCHLETESERIGDAMAEEIERLRDAPKVKPLDWQELRAHRLGCGPYELACNDSPTNPDAMWRVR